MTALVFSLQPDQVCVAMDTLVVGADDRMPLAFQRKFLSVPDSDLLVAGTGLAGFVTGWFDYLLSLTSLGDVDNVGSIAPSVLKASADAAGGSAPLPQRSITLATHEQRGSTLDMPTDQSPTSSRSVFLTRLD